MQGFALCQGAFPKSKHGNFSFKISQLWKPQMQQKKKRSSQNTLQIKPIFLWGICRTPAHVQTKQAAVIPRGVKIQIFISFYFALILFSTT